jgi:anti-sigma regulatory factor (Ser/Thr protein kinase)
MADFLALVPTEPSAISVLTERATAYLAESGVDQRAAHHVALVLDELLTNVATHGGAMEEPASVREDRPLGGLGLLLLRQVTERVDYERVGDRNRTTFWICRAASSA